MTSHQPLAGIDWPEKAFNGSLPPSQGGTHRNSDARKPMAFDAPKVAPAAWLPWPR